MSESATLPPLPALPEDVKAFAAEKGAAEYLPKVAAFVQQLFPHHPVSVRVEDDPELSYNRTIVFWVEVRGWDADQLFRVQQQWSRDIVLHCPPTHTHVFGLVVWPVE